MVANEAKSRGIDINVRIGVHTGMVMGGVIGTVRFHFDMWGAGVVGAMKMEEMGAKGRRAGTDDGRPWWWWWWCWW